MSIIEKLEVAKEFLSNGGKPKTPVFANSFHIYHIYSQVSSEDISESFLVAEKEVNISCPFNKTLVGKCHEDSW